MKFEFMPVEDNDLEVITFQIGRKPRGVKGIACRCPSGFPQVVVSEPVFQDGEKREKVFFPTTFWLSCHKLRQGVTRLESGGMISRLERVVSYNPYLKEKLTEAHAAYIHQRFSLIGREQFFHLQEVNYPWVSKVLQVGIAGIENFRHLKCLHAHVAHHLALMGNPIGEIVLSFLVRQSCPPGELTCQQWASDTSMTSQQDLASKPVKTP